MNSYRLELLRRFGGGIAHGLGMLATPGLVAFSTLVLTYLGISLRLALLGVSGIFLLIVGGVGVWFWRKSAVSGGGR